MTSTDTDQLTDTQVAEMRQAAAQCDFVRFTISDIHGIHRGRSVAKDYVGDFIKDGVAIFSGCVVLGPKSQVMLIKPGVSCNNFTHPMPGTFHMLPWAAGGKYKVGAFLCENRWPDGSPQLVDPRYVARQQINKLLSMGFHLKSGFEDEFVIIDGKTEKPITEGLGNHADLPFAEYEELLYDMHGLLKDSGVNIASIYKECSPGQFELVTATANDMAGVDMAFICKQAVKEICQSRGYKAVYMAQPAFGVFGSLRHYNMSLWNEEGQNVFYDESDKLGLSSIGRNWIGGILKHGKAITALCYPTVNCYRALHESWYPYKTVWGNDMRQNTVIRTKKLGEPGVFFEIRLSSGAANAYLLVAALLAAGMDGILNKTPLPQEMDPEADLLPSTLEEALVELERSETIVNALGKVFVEAFVKAKRDTELVELAGCGPPNDSPEAFQKEWDQYAKFV